MLRVITSNFTGFFQVKIKSRFDQLGHTSKSNFYCLDQVETSSLVLAVAGYHFYIVTELDRCRS